MQLPATLTLQQATATSRALDAAAAQGSGPFTVDASALATMDTSAIAVLLQARRAATAAGRPFAVGGAPAKLVQLARLYGVAELLGLPPAASTAASAAASTPASTPAGNA
jgi:phospholipid transport system transporter-binding protein